MWFARVTVAAVIEQNGKFLLVEELIQGKKMLNQPAGHLEDAETLIDAVIRETREETAYHFIPSSIVGIYQWKHPATNETYLRFAFSGKVTDHDPDQALDQGIVAAKWMSLEQIMVNKERHRSPQLETCITDYLAGEKWPLSLITNVNA